MLFLHLGLQRTVPKRKKLLDSDGHGGLRLRSYVFFNQRFQPMSSINAAKETNSIFILLKKK